MAEQLRHGCLQGSQRQDVADPQWGNYAEVFAKLPFGRFLLNSVFITFVSVTGAVSPSVKWSVNGSVI